MTVRNEADRLPHFLAHHRRLGVGHFLVVDNGSTDGTAQILRDAPDVSLWATTASYRASRFGVDWLTWLMIRHGHGRWCLTLDADEILVYPGWEERPLAALTAWLEARRIEGMGALLLDMYPEGPVGAGRYRPGDDPFTTLSWFDAGPYAARRQQPLGNLWVQGGARARAFFADAPQRAPTLNKLPLMKWNRRWVYVNSTHAVLPPRLNQLYGGPGGDAPSGILLHTKFLPLAIARAAEERARGEHFNDPAAFAAYYDAIAAGPTLWTPQSVRYQGWRQLVELGLMADGGWR